MNITLGMDYREVVFVQDLCGSAVGYNSFLYAFVYLLKICLGKILEILGYPTTYDNRFKIFQCGPIFPLRKMGQRVRTYDQTNCPLDIVFEVLAMNR